MRTRLRAAAIARGPGVIGRRPRAVAAALALRLVASALVPGGAARAQSAEQVEHDIAANREALARLREQSTSVFDELTALEQEIRLLEEGAAKAERSLNAAALRVAAAQGEENRARGELLERLREVGPRLRLRYALARPRRADLLLSARSANQMLRRKRELDALLAGDLEALGRARDAFHNVQARRAALEEAKADQAARMRDWQQSRARAQARRQDLAALNEKLLDEQGLREKTLRELARVQAELSQLVEDLGSEGRGGHFPRHKGRLRFPTLGIIEVGYGKVLNAKFNTVTFQKGLDIRAAEGSEVVAVAAGKIVHAAPFRGYGNLVIVDHGEGYHSLYAHLSAIERTTGEELEAGELIGHVGDTGSLKGPYLYFELREDGRPVDPKGWLAAPR